ncbi:hypothetical protein Tco_0941001 [Tanacetum coccineum]|uniref:Uncharacterized protein n=1 Tax=Tanacetum coccineum TaxID=301880 RepID=A0ABQ5DPL9_9ASTR
MPITWSHGVMLVNVKAKSRKKDEMPQKAIQVWEIFDVLVASISWAPFRLSRGKQVHSRGPLTLLSKWVLLKYELLSCLSAVSSSTIRVDKWRVSNRGLKSILKGPIAPDYEDSCARGFVLRSLELQSLA